MVIGFRRVMRQARKASRGAARRGEDPLRLAVMPLAESIDALGVECWTDAHPEEVPVELIVGTVSRADDFDRNLRPLRRHLRPRWESVAVGDAQGAAMPPVQLVRLGELYFISDGHHRVSVARASGKLAIDAQVKRVCTIAYACRCVTMLDLPAKAAERQFLERFPLRTDIRPWLWLDKAETWGRVEAAAMTWIFGSPHVSSDSVDDADLAQRVQDWWDHDVVPTARRCHGRSRTDLEDYLCALPERDRRDRCIT